MLVELLPVLWIWWPLLRAGFKATEDLVATHVALENGLEFLAVQTLVQVVAVLILIVHMLKECTYAAVEALCGRVHSVGVDRGEQQA